MGATTVINLMIMSLWNYIGEFLLFRWLFGSHEHNETKRDLSDKSASFGNKDIIDDNDTHTGFGRSHDNSYSRYDNRDYGYSQSYDDFHDEQDDYDMMDNDF
ncbi:hypothetical protein [Paramuribaculum intestinale]|uniref:hypothetical protein n=1 Tax=Paramuribaculum intestinale TaxID=2094151 RepID=UPI0027339A76|nr:hypothetical protein [Paramuribaculum intestinale]